MFKVYTRIFSDFFKHINIYKKSKTKTIHNRITKVPKNTSYIEG